MKWFVSLLLFLVSTNSLASKSYCNVAEIIDGVPSLDSVVAEYIKGQDLNIIMKNGAARANARWDVDGQFYQMSLTVEDVLVNSVIELPAKSGFLNLQYKGKNYSAQCRFELN
ncbi:MAG: hypothetical protein AABY64_10660 [Bdellovibrionota bacterium]